MEIRQMPTQTPLLVADLSKVEPVGGRVGGPRFFQRLALALQAKGLTLYEALAEQDVRLYWRTFNAALQKPRRLGGSAAQALSVEDAIRICRILGLNLAWLLLGVGPIWVDGRQEVVPPSPDEPWPTPRDFGVRARPPWWPRIHFANTYTFVILVVSERRGYGPLPEELAEWLKREFGAVRLRKTPNRFRIPVPPDVAERARQERVRPPRRSPTLRAFAEGVLDKVRAVFEAYRYRPAGP
jgi:hypothetical protein